MIGLSSPKKGLGRSSSSKLPQPASRKCISGWSLVKEACLHVAEVVRCIGGDICDVTVLSEMVSQPSTSDSEDEQEFLQYKLVILGDGAVGKTSLSLRFSEDKFSRR